MVHAYYPGIQEVGRGKRISNLRPAWDTQRNPVSEGRNKEKGGATQDRRVRTGDGNIKIFLWKKIVYRDWMEVLPHPSFI